MLKIGIQFFAHHKGGGSTKNGRDSESKRLGVKRADGQLVAGRQHSGSPERHPHPSRSGRGYRQRRHPVRPWLTARFKFERLGKRSQEGAPSTR